MYKEEYANRSDSLLKYLKKEINVRTDDANGTEVMAQSQTLTFNGFGFGPVYRTEGPQN